MKKGKYTWPILTVFVVLGVIWLVGCGTTGKSVKGEESVEDVADIDELLGLADKRVEAEEEDTIAEDDVLRLLGFEEEGQPTVGEEKSDTEKEAQKLEAEQAGLDTEEGSLREKTSQQEGEPSLLKGEEDKGVSPSREKTFPEWRASSFSDRYQEALQDYRSRQYREAIQKFEALLAVNTKHSLSDNCQYWIGESYYGLRNHQQAIVAFEKVFSFAKSNKDDAAQLKLGLCYMRLKDKERARGEFQKLIDNYPTSEYVSIAKRFLAKLD